MTWAWIALQLSLAIHVFVLVSFFFRTNGSLRVTYLFSFWHLPTKWDKLDTICCFHFSIFGITYNWLSYMFVITMRTAVTVSTVNFIHTVGRDTLCYVLVGKRILCFEANANSDAYVYVGTRRIRNESKRCHWKQSLFISFRWVHFPLLHAFYSMSRWTLLLLYRIGSLS